MENGFLKQNIHKVTKNEKNQEKMIIPMNLEKCRAQCNWNENQEN